MAQYPFVLLEADFKPISKGLQGLLLPLVFVGGLLNYMWIYKLASVCLQNHTYLKDLEYTEVK